MKDFSVFAYVCVFVVSGINGNGSDDTSSDEFWHETARYPCCSLHCVSKIYVIENQ